MTDADIVALYWARDEQAIAQTAQKFGAYCRKIAMNLLGSQEDAEECENDTWMAAWNSMPQNRPDKLAPYLGRITRNLALDLRERQNAKKRGGGQTEAVLEELEFCLPAGDHTAQEVESAETARSISAFLRSQPEQARNIFIRRYWYCDATADIANGKPDFGWNNPGAFGDNPGTSGCGFSCPFSKRRLRRYSCHADRYISRRSANVIRCFPFSRSRRL